MSKFDDIICELQQDTEVPKHVWEKYTDTLSKLSDKQWEKPSHTRSKRKIWPAVAASVLVIGSVSVSAAAHMQWSRSLQQGMQITGEQRLELENNQMASFVGQSVIQGDVTVTAQQSIVDNRFAYLSFKVEGYKIEDGMEPGFSDVSVVVDGDEGHTGGFSASFYDGLVQGDDGKAMHPDGAPLAEGEKTSYTMEDGSMEFQVMMVSDEIGHFINKPIHVELKDLGVYKEKAGDIAVGAEGHWSFDWILTGSDAVEKYELNASLGDSGATVMEAELSQISVSVKYDFPRQEEAEKVIDENGEEYMHTMYKEAPAFVGVRLKDGTMYTSLSRGGMGGYVAEDSDIYECTVALNRVIDVEQVESLLFIKSYPEGEQPLTKKNLYIVSIE